MDRNSSPEVATCSQPPLSNGHFLSEIWSDESRQVKYQEDQKLKFQHFHIAHVGQGPQPLLNQLGHDLINAHNRNDVLLGGLAAGGAGLQY